MSPFSFPSRRVLVLLAAILLSGTSAFAEKPAWNKDNGPDRKRPSSEARREDAGKRQRDEVRPGAYFRDEHRVAIRDYYGREYGAGKRCPPGLAKKANGCLPPGQAKKWQVGHVLPRDVIYYAVPPAVLVQLGPPPSGHKFVRIAGDILLIAIGTGMVIDAIEDLGR